MATKQAQRMMSYTVIFEPAAEGGYIVRIPALHDCVTEGDTLEEAREMARDCIQGYVESLLKDGAPIPADTPVKSRYHHEKISVSLVPV